MIKAIFCYEKSICLYLSDIDCTTNPCKNGGHCVDQADGDTCDCATGFTGATCDKRESAFDFCFVL